MKTNKTLINTLVYMMFFLVLSSIAFATTNDAVMYLSFDVEYNMTDLTGKHNNSNSGTTLNITGKYGESRGYDASADMINNSGGINLFDGTDNFTISMWVLMPNLDPGSNKYIFKTDNYLTVIRHETAVGSGNVNFIYRVGTGAKVMTVTLPDNTNFHHLVATYNTATGGVFYLNNDTVINDSSTGAGDTYGVAYDVIGSLGGGNDGFLGLIDEVGIWNRTLSKEEVNELYIATTNPYPPPVPLINGSIIDLLFANKTNDFKILFDEGENIFGFVNWTNKTGTAINDTNGQCNLTFVDGIEEIEGLNKNINYCTNVACDFSTLTESLTFKDDNSTAIVNEDLILVKDLCKYGGSKDLEILVECGTLNNNYDVADAEIPMCPSTNTITRDMSGFCANFTVINLTISTTEVPFSSRKEYREIEIDREYALFTNNLNYNSTSLLWEMNLTTEYYEHGNKSSYGNCSNTDTSFDNSTSEIITIVNIPPQIIFNGVTTELGFTNGSAGMIIEYASGLWNWSGQVIDDDLDHFNVSIYNSTHDLMINWTGLTVSEVLSTPNGMFAQFDRGNPFSINVTALDTAGAVSNLSSTFFVNDTTNPVCDLNGNYVYYNNQTININVTCSDENFFSLNITCDASADALVLTGLNTPSMNAIFNITHPVSETCVYKYCDGHTAQNLKREFDALTSESEIEVLADADSVAVLSSSTPGGVVSYTVLQDRLTYEFDFSSSLVDEHTFTLVTSPDAVYLKDDKYKGWIVSESLGIWFDMNSKSLDGKVKVKKVSPGVFEFTIKSVDKKIKFESIGELNCVSGSFTLTNAFANNEFINPTQSCPLDGDLADVAGVLVLFGILTIIILINTIILRVGVVDLVAGIGFIFLGAWLWQCSYLISNIIIVFGLIYGIWMGFRNPSYINEPPGFMR